MQKTVSAIQLTKSDKAAKFSSNKAKTSQMQDGKVQLAPELPRGLGYSLAAKADVIGYTTANKDDGKYYISFEAYDERVVGSRLKPLAQKILPLEYSAISNEILKYKEDE